jgi:hypothetical protein
MVVATTPSFKTWTNFLDQSVVQTVGWTKRAFDWN